VRTRARLSLGTVILICAAFCLLAKATTAQMPASQTPDNTAAGASEPPMPMMMGDEIFAHVLFDQFEGRTDDSESGLRWDGEGWVGTDMNRLWFRSEGFARDGTLNDGDVEAFYDRPLPRLQYFDGQIGIREDLDSGPHRTWVALGVEGLAPGFFEFEPTVYFSDGGHVAGRITGSYDLLIAQRLIAQPELEMNFYSKDDPQRRLGTGLSDLDTGLRVRYEISRKFAPYVGFAYTTEFGGTATFSRQIGESTAAPRFIFGLRFWY
jgi:copper resistance protein B